MDHASLASLVAELLTTVHLLSGAEMQQKICSGRSCAVRAFYHEEWGVYLDDARHPEQCFRPLHPRARTGPPPAEDHRQVRRRAELLRPAQYPGVGGLRDPESLTLPNRAHRVGRSSWAGRESARTRLWGSDPGTRIHSEYYWAGRLGNLCVVSHTSLKN